MKFWKTFRTKFRGKFDWNLDRKTLLILCGTIVLGIAMILTSILIYNASLHKKNTTRKPYSTRTTVSDTADRTDPSNGDDPTDREYEDGVDIRDLLPGYITPVA